MAEPAQVLPAEDGDEQKIPVNTVKQVIQAFDKGDDWIDFSPDDPESLVHTPEFKNLSYELQFLFRSYFQKDLNSQIIPVRISVLGLNPGSGSKAEIAEIINALFEHFDEVDFDKVVRIDKFEPLDPNEEDQEKVAQQQYFLINSFVPDLAKYAKGVEITTPGQQPEEGAAAPEEAAAAEQADAGDEGEGFDFSGDQDQEGAQAEAGGQDATPQQPPTEQPITVPKPTEPLSDQTVAASLDAKALKVLELEVIRESTIVQRRIRSMYRAEGIEDFELTQDLIDAIEVQVRAALKPELLGKGHLTVIEKSRVISAAFSGLKPMLPQKADILKQVQKAQPAPTELTITNDHFTQLANTELQKAENQTAELEQEHKDVAKEIFNKELEKIQQQSTVADMRPEHVTQTADLVFNTFGKSIDQLDEIDLAQVGLAASAFGYGEGVRAKFLEAVNKEIIGTHLNEQIAQQLAQKTEQLARQYQRDPKAGLEASLALYGLDPTAFDSQKAIEIANRFAGSLDSPTLLFDQMGDVFDELNPRFSRELQTEFRQYVWAKKIQIANETGNPLATQANMHAPDPNAAVEVLQMENISQMYSQFDRDKIISFAQFRPNLDPTQTTDVALQAQLVEAQKLRNSWMDSYREYISALSKQEQFGLGQELNIFPQEYTVDGVLDQQGFLEAIYNAHANQQLYNFAGDANASMTIGADGQIQQPAGGWLNAAQRFGQVGSKITGLRRKAVAKTGQLASQVVKKGIIRTVAPAVGAGAVGLGAGAIISQLLGIAGTAARTLTGAVGGAAAGFLVGGPVGALIGGIAGGLLGFLATGGAEVGLTGIGGVKGFASTGAGKLSLMGKSVASNTANVLTGTGGTTPIWPTAAAVIAPPLLIAGMTTLTMTTILTAFLPDASTTQVAPYFVTDIVESKYIEVTKKPSIANSDTPTTISYEITIAKKTTDDAKEAVVRIDEILDTPAAQAKDNRSVTPPTLPQEFLDAVAPFRGQILEEGQPIVLNVTLDFSAPDFQDTLAINNLKVEYSLSDTEDEEANVRAQTCIGDCPIGVVAPCWPIKGPVTQGPYGRGPYSNPIINQDTRAMGITHYNYTSDAYDIGTNLVIGIPIYASTPGTVIYAQAGTGGLKGYGNLVQIDHGGFQTFYAHMHEIKATVGQTITGGEEIGTVGSTGNSSGPHLHYEVVGLQEYVLETILDPDKRGSSTIGPRCDEYYGR